MHVQVPSSVVRNEDVHLTSGDFLLYARLCFLYFKNYKNEEIKVDHKKLMNNLHISDTRTLKKRLGSLYKNKLINNEITKFPKKGEIVILFNGKISVESKHFTQMNVKIFDYLEEIDEHSFRLVFYYKSHINLNSKDEGKKIDFCFVGMDTLANNLKMAKKTIVESNKVLSKCKLIKIEKHKLKTNYEYDQNDELVYDKYNNHYKLNNELF
jgi:hypothetical protein